MTNKLLAFHGKPEIKEAYLARITAHEKADEIIHGTYWEKGKGCAVGCTVHSDKHNAYETELGIPVWLARVEDTLFERQSNEDSKTFPRRFLEAIKPGVDCNEAFHPYLVLIVQSVLPFCNDKTRQAVQDTLSLLQDKCTGRDKLSAAKRALREAATYAGNTAAYAAYAAYAYAYAANTADAAAYAAAAAYAYAAYAAAYAAEAAYAYAANTADAAAYAAAANTADAAAYAAYAAYTADAAAYAAAYAYAAKAAGIHAKRLADELLEILSNLKPQE